VPPGTSAMHARILLPLLLLLAGQAAGQTSYPMITLTTPVAVQRGQTADVFVAGQMNFAGVYKALFEGDGLSVEGLPPLTPAPKFPVKGVKMKVKIAADAALGVRDFRLGSTLGASSIGQLVVVDAPVVYEAGNNNTIQTA